MALWEQLFFLMRYAGSHTSTAGSQISNVEKLESYSPVISNKKIPNLKKNKLRLSYKLKQ